MPSLRNDNKFYIVQSLASYNMPSQAAGAVYEHFELKIERTHVQQVDPNLG